MGSRGHKLSAPTACRGDAGGTRPSPRHAAVGRSTRRPLSGTAVEGEVTPCPDATSPSPINELNVLEES